MIGIPLVRESETTDERAREAFRDVRSALRIPVATLLFQAWAAYPKFLDVTWRRLRPNVLSDDFAGLAGRLETNVREGVGAWTIADHAAALRARSLGESEIARMRELIGLFTNVNPKLAILAAAVAAALDGKPVGGVGTKGPHRERERAPQQEFRGVRVVLIEERDAPPRVRTIYDDMKATLGLPFIETEYRAMASYPDWLEVWWRDCKPVCESDRYRGLGVELARAAAQAAAKLPHRLSLSENLLASSELEGEQRAGLQRTTVMFAQTLPSLMINVEIARRGLAEQ
jgi:halocarboxylic acid dehydrogenase DehI